MPTVKAWCFTFNMSLIRVSDVSSSHPFAMANQMKFPPDPGVPPREQYYIRHSPACLGPSLPVCLVSLSKDTIPSWSCQMFPLHYYFYAKQSGLLRQSSMNAATKPRSAAASEEYCRTGAWIYSSFKKILELLKLCFEFWFSSKHMTSLSVMRE